MNISATLFFFRRIAYMKPKIGWIMIMFKQIKNKLIITLINYTKHILIFSVAVVVLSACGGGGGGGSSSINDDPYIEPPPPSPTTVFPSQISKPNVTVVNDNGSLIIAESGLSLYTFDNDEINSSSCEGTPDDTDTCAGQWPPLLAGEGAEIDELMTIVTRSEGDMQWAYKGQPLYHWYQDSAQGDIGGDGINNVWHLARPTPLMSANLSGVNSYIGNETILSVSDSSGVLSQMRTDKAGFALYTFDNDPVNDTACAGDCINIWPPLLADTGAMAMPPLSIVEVSNGNMQWVYKGKPLYFFVNDNAAGDVNGDEVNNIWHIATQEPAIQRTTANGRSLSATGMVNVSSLANTVTAMDKDGFSLYVFDNDTMGTSTCIDGCLDIWPAFVANEEDVAIGEFSLISRNDGTKQWAFQDMPLYFFKNDFARGEINGDGLNGIWHLIPPINTVLKQEINTLGATLTLEGAVHTLIRDENTNEFVDSIANKTGIALYTFDNDTAGVSLCEGDCLAAWPPLIADKTDVATAPFSIITRSNGSKQWAINDMALYFFTPDETADDIKGENVNAIWHVARPAPIKVDDHETEGPLLVAHGDVLDSIGKTADELKGLTLYTFDADVKNSGVSVCFDGCAATWPPIYAISPEQAFGDYTIISRAENDTITYQWSYQGLPLYFYIGDSEMGDTTGDYPSWTIARP